MLTNSTARAGQCAGVSLTLAATLLMSLAPVVAKPASATQAEPVVNDAPHTIPALREWSGGQGSFALGSSPRIVVTRGQWQLLDEARLFASDMKVLTGRELPIASGAPGPGDIGLALGSRETGLGGEGYRMSIDDRVVISARTDAGVFYGTRTLLQLFRQSPAIPAGTARDWPRYPERGLMVDVARSMFSMDWIKSHIRELGYLKLNYLQLHLSDDQGFRVESDAHPEIVSEQHYTKDQIREIVDLAARHHITVVPEIDMPGHMAAALKPHPEFQLRTVAGLARPPASKLDITNPAARAFARELIDEFAPLFPGQYFHIGADEFMVLDSYDLYPQLAQYARERYGPQATARDAVIDFVNWVEPAVRAHGKTMRTWNDGLHSDGVVEPNPAIVVDYWTESELTPQMLLDRGHQVMNAGWYPTYYVVAPHQTIEPVTNDMPASAYETWEVHRFSGLDRSKVHLVDPDEPGNLGSKVHLWGDFNAVAPYESEEQSAEGIAAQLRIVAQKTWRSKQLTETWEEFQPIMAAVGHAPGYSASS